MVQSIGDENEVATRKKPPPMTMAVEAFKSYSVCLTIIETSIKVNAFLRDKTGNTEITFF